MTRLVQSTAACVAAFSALGAVASANAEAPKVSLEVERPHREVKTRISLPDTNAAPKAPIQFGNLSAMKAAEIAALVNGLIGHTAYGVTIQSAVALPQINRLIGSEAARIDVLEILHDGSVVVLARNADGTPNIDGQIFLIAPTGAVLCTLRQSLSHAASTRGRQYYEIMLDVSGSMEAALEETKRAALSFIDRMTPAANCRVSYYNHNYHVLGVMIGYSGGWRPCTAANFDLSSIKSSGGTESSKALIAAYAELQKPALTDSLKAVFVATDGYGITDADLSALLQSKGSIPTFVYFAGNFDTQRYEQWVESFIYGNQTGDVTAAFDEFAARYVSAQVVNPNACASISPAAQP